MDGLDGFVGDWGIRNREQWIGLTDFDEVILIILLRNYNPIQIAPEWSKVRETSYARSQSVIIVCDSPFP